MRFSPELEEGRLIKRYKRFLADIETSTGELITIHCPNTGSMLNCMVEGGQVWFSRSNDPKRKLPGTWEISQTPQGRLACVNTGRANHLIEETLQRLKPPVWPEDLFGAVDKPLAAQGRALFAENCAGCHVPSVTEENGRPAAP